MKLTSISECDKISLTISGFPLSIAACRAVLSKNKNIISFKYEI